MSYKSNTRFGNTNTTKIEYDYSQGNYTLPLNPDNESVSTVMRDIINHADSVDYLDIEFTKEQEETKHIYKVRLFKAYTIEEPSTNTENVADKYVEFVNPYIANSDMLISATYQDNKPSLSQYAMGVGSYLSGVGLVLSKITITMRR